MKKETCGPCVSWKIEDGHVRGAIRVASSGDTLAEFNDSTSSALQSKHPPTPSDCSIPPLSSVPPPSLEVTPGLVVKAIMSFPNGSAGGLDKMCPR